MGTSSSYDGPTGCTPLLPPWAPPPDLPDELEPEDGPDDHGPDEPPVEDPGDDHSDHVEDVVPIEWDRPKDNLSRFASNGGMRDRRGGERLARVGRDFVRAQGGARSAARAAAAGRATTGRLGQFLTQAATLGTAAALLRWEVADYVGRDVRSLLSALVDVLAPAGATNEEAVARDALAETLAEIFEEQPGADGFAILEALTPDLIQTILERYAARYVYTRLMQVLGKRLYERAGTALEARRLEREVEEFVFNTARLSFGRVDVMRVDWSGADGRALIEDVFEDGYRFLEGGL